MGGRQKLCLALGGGGARGLSHLGVLQVLERERVAFDGILGISAGALVGAAYALHPDGLEITRRALAYLKSDAFRGDIFRKVLFRSDEVQRNVLGALLRNIKKGYIFSNLLRREAIFPTQRLEGVVNDLIPDRTFEDTRIPFAVPAIDVRSGEEVLLTEGSLRKAVLASCSLPGFFPPVEHQGMLLADAGIIGPVPVGAARRKFPGASVIAVDISQRIERIERIDLGIEALLRMESVAGKRLNDLELSLADLVIHPEVGERCWSDFSAIEELVTCGIEAAESQMLKIRRLIAERRIPFWKTPTSPA
jgi:NTE family protein